MGSFCSPLELKLHRQLQLPRRTEISGWRTGPARNEAIGGRSGGHCQTGISEISLIQHVECTELELEVQALRDAGILDESNIEVRHTRTDDRVAAQISEPEGYSVGPLLHENIAGLTRQSRVSNVSDAGRASVGGRTKAGDRRSDDIRTENRRSRKRSVGDTEVQGVTGLCGLN